MKKIVTAFKLGAICLASCSKDDAVSNSIVGTWVFTGQMTNSFAYPSVLHMSLRLNFTMETNFNPKPCLSNRLEARQDTAANVRRDLFKLDRWR